jgi:hypothetical protein
MSEERALPAKALASARGCHNEEVASQQYMGSGESLPFYNPNSCIPTLNNGILNLLALGA